MIIHESQLAATARPLALAHRKDVIAESLTVRGERWWRLKDPLRLQFWQLGEEEYFLWSQLQAGMSLQELQLRFLQRFAPRRIELPHLHQFLGSLHREGLVFSTAAGQAEILLERHEEQSSRRRLQSLTNLLAIRFRGFDPTRLLEWLYPRAAWMFAPWSLVCFSLLVISAVLLAIIQAGQIAARLPHATDFFTAQNLMWLAVSLAVVKVLHELGHALTCRHLGGRCHELGVMLLIFTPCLYCNVSDAWLMPSRWRRMAISAAGMAIELVLAAAATWLWWWSEPGLISNLCLNVMVICSVNTLLFNGNPLLRFDGYFLLSDFLEVPNLRQASDQWLRDWIGRVVLGIPPTESSALSRDREFVVATYAWLSLTYRVGLTLVVWWFIYHWLAEKRLAIVGAAIVLVSAAAMAGQTGWIAWKTWSAARQNRRVRSGRSLIAVIVVTAVVGVVCFLPFPHSVVAPATLRPADAVTVYATISGTLVQGVAPGIQVAEGDVLAILRNRDLELDLLRLTSERDVLVRQVDSLKKRQVQESRSTVTTAAGQLKIVEQQLADVIGQLEQKRADQQQLTIRAPRDGVVIAARNIHLHPSSNELPRWRGTPLDARNIGCALDPGDILCQVGQLDRREAVIVVEQSDIDSVREGESVTVQIDELAQRNLSGRVIAVAELSAEGVPAELEAKRLLPLSRAGDEPQLVGTHYQVTADLLPGPSLPFGSSGRAKIRVAPQTIAERIYHQLCRIFQ